jgi:hypothetical protein
LSEAPVLVCPNYSKDFLIFSFTSRNTIVVVLLQKNDENYEQTIALFSKILRDSDLKYNIIEKKEYALVKDLKSFRDYILQSKIMYLAVWSKKFLEIKPTKLIKGQGLEKLLEKSNCKSIGINLISQTSKPFLESLEET